MLISNVAAVFRPPSDGNLKVAATFSRIRSKCLGSSRVGVPPPKKTVLTPSLDSPSTPPRLALLARDRSGSLGTPLSIKDGEGNYGVMVGNKMFKVIVAAVTYFHGNEGEEAVILVPKDTESQWAAIENIIKSSSSL